jgi:HIV Tat-specific factor 1
MFTLQELEEDPTALIELKLDVREECEKIGEVTNVVLFDAEPDGVMSVRFADEEDAVKCIKVWPPYKCDIHCRQ